MARYKLNPELYGPLPTYKLGQQAQKYRESGQYELYISCMEQLHDIGYEDAAHFLDYFYMYETSANAKEFLSISKAIEWFETGVAMKEKHCFRGLINHYSGAKDKSLRDYQKAAHTPIWQAKRSGLTYSGLRELHMVT